MDAQTDEECARQVQQGDHNAFGILVDRYQEKLLRYGKRFLSAQEDVEDIVQDVFVSAYQKIQSFDPSQRFSPWIYRIAHNAFIDGLKKKTRSPFINMDFDALLSHAAGDELVEKERDRKEMRTMIDKGLDRLSPKYREAIILYYLEELSYKEIADVLQVPLGTVGARVKRAKEDLKNIYKKMDIDHGS
jgi:RNA polymerase sigma-70 factor (ECF subfamily)